jgi:sortase A
MRRLARVLGTLLVVAGIGLLAWTVTVWQWQDPVTAVYTHMEQRSLAAGYAELASSFAAEPVSAEEGDPRERIPGLAAQHRKTLKRGDPVGRLKVPRLGLDIVVVEGTDDVTLRRGPGRHEATYLPGEGELVYVAGHRTTYSAPFARIDELRPGDTIVLDVPYGRFEYQVTHHRIVGERETSVLESQGEETLALQACHPRFFATHRYIAYAAPVTATSADERPADSAEAATG